MTIGERARQEQLERAERDPRRQWGWGVSQMASPEERRAWQALDTQGAIERGEATVADLPEQYGGRPQGTTRRAIRMQSEWDARQSARLAEEQAIAAREKEMREIEMFNLDREIKERTLDSSIEQKRFDMSMEAITESQVDSAFKILNMNRGEPDAAQRSVDMMIEYGLGQAFNDPRVKSALDRLGSLNKQDNDVAMVREQREQQRRLMNIESDARQSGASEKEIESARRIDPDGNVYVDEAALMRVRDNAKLREKQEGAREPARTRVETLRSEIVGLEAKIETFEEEDEGNEKILELRGLLAEKRAQLKDEQGGAEEPEEKPKSDLPNNGEVRNGFRYTGPSNDKKAASNPDNWVRE
jgi:hypothetical protein